MASEESPLAGLQRDGHPAVRAAALTPDRARELVDDPARETSWTVLERAARSADPALPPTLVLERHKRYGDTVLWWLRRNSA